MELREGYKQTEVGVIPDDWNVLPVKEAYDICNTLRLPLSEKVRREMQGSYPYYGPTKIQDYINEYRVKGEYCLIGEDGDHFLKWSEMPMTLLVRGKFNVNNHAHLIKGKKNETSWFYFYFNNRDITKHLTRQGAGRYKLNKSSLENIPLAIPPTKTEQTAIATALSDADALIQSLKKLIAKKRLIKQGAMQELLKPKEGWVVKKLGTDCELITKGTTPTSIGENFQSSGISFIKIESLGEDGNILMDKIAFIDRKTNNLLMRSQLKVNDVLISIAGALGRVAIVKKDILPANTNQALAIARLKSEATLELSYLFHFLKSNRIQKHIEAISVQGAQANLSLENINDLPIDKPSTKAEQVRIAEILSDMDTEISTLETKLTKYKQVKQGMMQELLTGRIRLI